MISLENFFVRSLIVLALILSLPKNSAHANGFVEHFDDADFAKRWFFSNYDQGGAHFPTAWRRDRASVVLPSTNSFGQGSLILRLEPNPVEGGKPFVGAEVQRGDDYHFGRYEVLMKAGRGEGVVSAFFTYTGPYFGDPHDEIDFEFLGRDTRRVWINAFADGKKMPGEWLELGFDAAAAPHLYRFDWRPDSITWFVNGREIYSITSETHAIPQAPSKIFMNIWAGNHDQINWLGKVEDTTSSVAQYYCVSYRAFVDLGLSCSDYIASWP